MTLLRITEIFYSLQGESLRVGLPTVFIRLTGCPLRCTYCDTAYAFTGGQKQTLDEILNQVRSFKTQYVCVTGGEPLAQPGVFELMQRLCDEGFKVSLETSGALSLADVDRRVMQVMDLKTPSSSECEKNLWNNLAFLKPEDQIKIVIMNRTDYEWARDIVQTKRLEQYCEILFSPSYGELVLSDLAAWILEDHLPVRMQVQLHKLIWGEQRGV